MLSPVDEGIAHVFACWIGVGWDGLGGDHITMEVFILNCQWAGCKFLVVADMVWSENS